MDLSGHIFETLHVDGEFVLCRCHNRTSPNQHAPSFLALMPRSEHPLPDCIRKMQREHSLRAKLDPAWAVRALELTHHEGQTMLVLEDPGCEPLDRMLGAEIELGQFLRIAIGISATLGHLHRRGLVHKDIKPGNIMLEPTTGRAWLMGFGMASSLGRERQSPEPPECIAGTLAYMAPEQTGRMNRSVDHRADLYSLGVLLYRMLTGRLPFETTDPLEGVHCLIALLPQPPAELLRGIPQQVSDIVLKLLAKMPEDRYQTASGLQFDLQQCLAQLEETGEIQAFTLASRDLLERLSISEKLYGREAERAAALNASERVAATGEPKFVVVSGYSGIGKSSLVHEIQKTITRERGLFLEGKFDQYKQNIPYAGFAQAFQQLVKQILAGSEEEVSHWKQQITHALGNKGQIILDLIPQMELLLGPQPTLPQLPPQEAQNRFHLVFRRLLSALARQEHPVSIFLDDLHWADAGSLELVEHITTHPETRYLLLVGAYRDNEVTPSHPLVGMLERVGQVRTILDIPLGPLDSDSLCQLLADTLHSKRLDVSPLAELVLAKTGGNPFFVRQFLRILHENGLIWFDASCPAWSWDIERIREANVTENLLELLAARMHKLGPETQEALKLGACLGNEFDLEIVSLVSGKRIPELARDLEPAVADGLLQLGSATAAPCRDHDSALQLAAPVRYRWMHDRLQQAAYCLIPEVQRPNIHLRIGRLLREQLQAGNTGAKVFDAANHLNRGAQLLQTPDERYRLAELNLQAGRTAKNASAYASALEYFSAGQELLGPEPWEVRYELAFSLYLERACCAWLCGRFETAANALAEIWSRARNCTDLAEVCRVQVNLETTQGRLVQALHTFKSAFPRLFGMELQLHPSEADCERLLRVPGRNWRGGPSKISAGCRSQAIRRRGRWWPFSPPPCRLHICQTTDCTTCCAATWCE